MEYQNPNNYTADQLEVLIKHILDISNFDLNGQFKEKLAQIIHSECGYTRKDDNQINLKLNWIAKYMQIEGYDRIDYSRVEDKVVRNQLSRDCIEMTKHRLGQYDYTINFDEFCRFAQMQVEELINYYYIKKFDKDFYKVVAFILDNINRSDKKKNYSFVNMSEIGHLSYYLKISSLVEAFNLGYESKNCLLFINNLRNEASHRNSLTIVGEDEVLLKLVKIGIDVDKFLDKTDRSEEVIQLYYKGTYIRDKRKKDFNKIIFNLEKLKGILLADLA